MVLCHFRQFLSIETFVRYYPCIGTSLKVSDVFEGLYLNIRFLIDMNYDRSRVEDNVTIRGKIESEIFETLNRGMLTLLNDPLISEKNFVLVHRKKEFS